MAVGDAYVFEYIWRKGFRVNPCQPAWIAQPEGSRYYLQMHELFSTQSGLLTTLKKKALENTVEKEENAGNHSVFNSITKRKLSF